MPNSSGSSPPMRKLVYLVATTLDGFIAAEDGSHGAFLQGGEHFDDLVADYPEMFPGHFRATLGITAPNRRFDTVIMGRATFEVGEHAGVTNPYPHLRQFVFSRTRRASPDPAVTFVSTSPRALVRDLKHHASSDAGDIWLCGGAALAAELADEIDELSLKINPVLIGRGIPLFREPISTARATLLSHRTYPNGFVRAHYALARVPSGAPTPA